ncbi:hypothetical protein [Halorubrum kocurii]|uniref:hypothetical protein n=1 Tax=Halorubrum kocurii TaxID=478441 RepID=UPI0012680112|nr:hypothetical protein [Halorubrum kocurii]
MKDESAVTKTITYDTENCSICETEVALDSSVPKDAFESKGYAVILGEGKVNKRIEEEGNWDFELKFNLDATDQKHPSVSGYIICEDCAYSMHDHPESADYYYGSIPTEIDSTSISSDLGTADDQLKIALAILLVLSVVIIMFVL